MFHVSITSYVRLSDGATMVPLAGEQGCFVNALYRAAPHAEAFQIADCMMPLGVFDRPPPSPPSGDWKLEENTRRWWRLKPLSVSDLWQPASVTRATRFICLECIRRPAKILVTRGPTVWLNGALLLTVAQNGFGIINSRRGSRPRYAKLKMGGVDLETPQPAPLSHSLWGDVAHIKTEFDLKAVIHADDAGFASQSFALKAAEKSAAKLGSIIWKAPAIGGKVTVTNPNRPCVEIEAKQASLPSERLDQHVAFFARWNAGGDHPVMRWVDGGDDSASEGRRLYVRQPGGGVYSPIWHRRRHWCEGDLEGPKSIVYLGTPAAHECPPGKSTDKWPFKRMCSRDSRLADLFYVGVTHLNCWSTSGMDAKHPDHLYRGRAEQRRATYRGAVDALKKQEATTKSPITAVIEAVLIDRALIGRLRYLSRYKNNTLSSRDLMDVLCGGLKVLEDYYRRNGAQEGETISEWVDTSYIGEDGHEVILEPWPTHWSQFLREFKYREELDSREMRGTSRLKCAN